MIHNAWHDVSCKSPCPICNHDGWCRISADQKTVLCRRVSTGGTMKTDRNGTPFFQHYVDGGPEKFTRIETVTTRDTKKERADVVTLSTVYNALLHDLTLSRSNRKELLSRGMFDGQIDWRGYKTLPPSGSPWNREDVAGRLADRFGNDVLATVPGFIQHQSKAGNWYWTITGKAGLLIPVRDFEGQVIALLIHPDKPGNGGKYVWFTSKYEGGPGPGCPAHVPLMMPDLVASDAHKVAVYEGILKADIAAALDPEHLPAIGISGHQSWRPAIPIIKALKVETARYYPDPDAWTKADVGRSLKAFWYAIKNEGFKVELGRFGGN